MRYFRKLRVFAVALLMPVLLPLLMMGLLLRGPKKSSKKTLEPAQLDQKIPSPLGSKYRAANTKATPSPQAPCD